MKPSVCSATESRLTPPVQPIATPCLSHARRSTLSRPTPYLEMILSFGQCRKSSSLMRSRPTIAPSAPERNSFSYCAFSIAPVELKMLFGKISSSLAFRKPSLEKAADVTAMNMGLTISAGSRPAIAVHPMVREGQLLNGLREILLDSFEFHVDAVHQEEQEDDGHPKKSAQAGLTLAKRSDQNIDDSRE